MLNTQISTLACSSTVCNFPWQQMLKLQNTDSAQSVTTADNNTSVMLQIEDIWLFRYREKHSITLRRVWWVWWRGLTGQNWLTSSIQLQFKLHLKWKASKTHVNKHYKLLTVGTDWFTERADHHVFLLQVHRSQDASAIVIIIIIIRKFVSMSINKGCKQLKKNMRGNIKEIKDTTKYSQK